MVFRVRGAHSATYSHAGTIGKGRTISPDRFVRPFSRPKRCPVRACRCVAVPRVDNTAGLDFGAIAISPYYRRLLEANGLAAVAEDEWRTNDYRKYAEYIMLGLPTDSIESSLIPNADGALVRGKPNPSLILSQRIDVPPGLETPSPRLFASLSDKWPEGDIDGMSGGPLFGINGWSEEPPIVGVQIKWAPTERFIVGCPITVFGPVLEEQINRR